MTDVQYIDAHDFYNWAKKEEEDGTIKFLFLSVDDYERLLFFPSEACNGIKYVDATMKLHAAFPSTPRWGTRLVFVKNFLDIFQAWSSLRRLDNGWFAAKEE